MRRFLQIVALAAFVLFVAAVIGLFVLGCGCVGNTTVTAARFSERRADHTQLRAFLRAMPKGADLHVHLSGAVYAEDFIGWATAAKLCVQRADYKLVPPDSQQQCASPQTRPAADALTDQSFYDDVVNALSMRNYIPTQSEPSGHDQFFVTFGKYGEISWRVPGQMTAFLLRRYAAEQVQHTELMITLTPQDPELKKELLDEVGKAADPAAKLALLKDYIARAVPNARKSIDEWQATTRKELGCDTGTPEPGCAITYRYIAQINRNSDAAKVFANTALAAALVRADDRIGGLNFVGPEDYRIARSDYREHMKTIGFLTRKNRTAREVPVALHAGELWLGLVPPDDLTFHIGDAVETAGAKRIGHGVALAYERRSDELLAAMRNKMVAVEINLTSNDVILGVRGKDHPLMAYQAAKVPVVLSTDDAGVSRIDLTNEYFRAARDYPLSYGTLKTIARTSIEHAFLGDTAKSKAVKELDEAFRKFEQDVVKQGSLFGNAWAIVVSWFR